LELALDFIHWEHVQRFIAKAAARTCSFESEGSEYPCNPQATQVYYRMKSLISRQIRFCLPTFILKSKSIKQPLLFRRVHYLQIRESPGIELVAFIGQERKPLISSGTLFQIPSSLKTVRRFGVPIFLPSHSRDLTDTMSIISAT